MNKNYLLSFAIIILISVSLVSATLNVSLSDQGTEVTNTTSGALLTLGDLTVLIYDALTGGNLIYNETFSGAIGNGSWNVMLGEIKNLPLEFGRKYFKDYLIAGEDASFVNGTGQTVARQFFYSTLGDINSSKLFGIIKVLGSKVGIGTDTPSSTLEVNGTLGLNSFTSLGSDTGYMFKNVNGTLYWNATTISVAFNGSSNSTNGTLGLVLAPQSGEQGQCLKGDGTWGDCGSDFVCPTGFTMVENKGFQMGCMQNDEQGTGTWATASNACFTTYGGRLPGNSEIYIAFQNYALSNENDDGEWIDIALEETGGITEAAYWDGPNTKFWGVGWTTTLSYRCFIPAGGGGSTEGGAGFYGSLKWDTTTGCSFGYTGTTFTVSNGDTACDDNARTALGLTTSVVDVGNAEGQLPQIKFASMPAGYYKLTASGNIRTKNNASCTYRFNHDLTGQNTSSTGIYDSNSTVGSTANIVGTFYFTSDQGASTLSLHGAEFTADGCSIDVKNDANEFEISVYYFPSFGTAKNDTVFSDLDGDTRINVDGQGSDSDNMTFFTAGIERMVIKNDGNVGIGTSSPDQRLHSIINSTTQFDYAAKFENTGNSANTDGILVKLGVTGDPGTSNNFIQFSDADTSDIGAIEGTGAGGITLFTASDERLKENIRETQYGLEDLAQIQVSDFNFIGSNVPTTGFVAQQLYKFYPLAVSVGGEDELKEPWKVSRGSLAPLIVKAIQELKAQLDEKNSEIQLLKSELCSRDASYSWCKTSLFSLV